MQLLTQAKLQMEGFTRVNYLNANANASINAWNETLSFSYDSEATWKRGQEYFTAGFAIFSEISSPCKTVHFPLKKLKQLTNYAAPIFFSDLDKIHDQIIK